MFSNSCREWQLRMLEVLDRATTIVMGTSKQGEDMKKIVAVLALLYSTTFAQAQTLTSHDVARRSVERRAIEAVNWGMPAVNFDLMLQAMIREAKGAPNQIVYWSRPFDWKNQTLTPNPDTIYFMPFFNTKDAGPMVLEIPAAEGGSITGTVMDCWQAPFEDVGPAGVDKGKGGKYLILPPDYKETIPDGYIAMPSANYQGYALLRSILKGRSDADVAEAVAYGKRIKLYPLSQASNPPSTTFVDAINVVFDATIPYDLRYFRSLDRIVQIEPWLVRDKVMIDMLKSIGIEKGKSFQPDAKMQAILKSAATEAKDWLAARYDKELPIYFSGTQWVFPATPELSKTVVSNYETAELYSIDARGLTDTYAYSTIKHIGAGQFYLVAIKDKAGRAFDGSRSYRLSVPPNAPVRQYWSAVLYDRDTHALIRDASRASRSSQSEGLQKNADGSVDLYFGPKAPAGKETNWIPTSPKRQFEIMFRLYGPEKPLFDKTWQLPDTVSSSEAPVRF
jgi:hypothetical protein